MGQKEDARITPPLAREICERLGITAMLFGTIAPLGTSYVISLEAVGARSGETIAREQALAEFERIVARRSISPASPLYPLAHLGIARAAALGGDATRSRSAHERLFSLWQNADADLPALAVARQEYARLSPN
jgi:hypothetical protein